MVNILYGALLQSTETFWALESVHVLFVLLLCAKLQLSNMN